MANRLNLPEADLKIVKQILRQYVPNYEIWVFGSRITPNAKKFSDLDLVIKTKKPLPIDTLLELKEAFSDSVLPIKIDVLDWSRTNEPFRQIIMKNYLPFDQ